NPPRHHAPFMEVLPRKTCHCSDCSASNGMKRLLGWEPKALVSSVDARNAPWIHDGAQSPASRTLRTAARPAQQRREIGGLLDCKRAAGERRGADVSRTNPASKWITAWARHRSSSSPVESSSARAGS